MIPSRPLTLVEIIGETFSIHRRVFPRYVLLFLLLVVPGGALVTCGTLGLTEYVLETGQHTHAFNDNDITKLRDEVRDSLEKQNPIFQQRLRATTNDSTHAALDSAQGNSSKVLTCISTSINEDGSNVALILLGTLLIVIGLFALTTSVIELTCASFEKRPLELVYSLKASILRHTWKALLLYVFYLLLSFIAHSITSMIDKVSPDAAGALSGFVMVAQLYIIIRMIITIPTLVSEDLGPFASLHRAWSLTYRSGWRIFGTTVAFGILFFVGAMFTVFFAQFIFGSVVTSFGDFLTRDHITISWLLGTLPGFIIGVAAEISFILLLLYALQPVFATILYYDLRTRRDGPLVYLEEESTEPIAP